MMVCHKCAVPFDPLTRVFSIPVRFRAGLAIGKSLMSAGCWLGRSKKSDCLIEIRVHEDS